MGFIFIFFIYFFVLIVVIAALLFICLLVMVKFFYGREKYSVFECGFDLLSALRLPFSLHFYIISIIFLIFDVELVLLLPFIYVFKFYGFFYMLLVFFFFFLVLMIGFFYEWWGGFLGWLI